MAQKPSKQECVIYINQGDSLFKAEQFIQARELYYKAYYCDSTNAINEKIKLCYKRSIEADSEYKEGDVTIKIINKADEYFSKGNYQKAKEFYFRANIVKPNDSICNIKFKICLHKTIFDTTYNSTYDECIKIADSYFMVDKYCEAEEYYFIAMRLIPNAYYPEGMVSIIERRTNLIEPK